jgi:hypothetical protein
MISAALFALAAVQTTSVSDYFPLNDGDEYVFTDEAGLQSYTITDRVKGPVKVGDKEAFQVDSYLGSKTFGSAFYSVEGKKVMVVAYEKEKPLPSPFPVFQLPEEGARWAFSGSTTFLDEDVAVAIVGEVKKTKNYTFLGQSKEAIEVKMKTDDGRIVTEQTSIYAKGIGLLEMREVITINKRKQERKRRLVSYKPGKGSE